MSPSLPEPITLTISHILSQANFCFRDFNGFSLGRLVKICANFSYSSGVLRMPSIVCYPYLLFVWRSETSYQYLFFRAPQRRPVTLPPEGPVESQLERDI